MDVFAQLKVNQSMQLLKPGIEFEGFGLTFSAPEEEIDQIKGAAKSAKKRDKLRKDFEKMVLKSDANINSLEIYKALKYPAKAKADNTILRNCFSFDPNTAMMEASTGLTGITSQKFSIVDRILTKRDDESIKREFMQELLKQELKEDHDNHRELSGFDFFGDN